MNYETQLRGGLGSVVQDAEEDAVRRRRRLVLIAGLLIVLILFALSFAGWYRLNKGKQQAGVVQVPVVTIMQARSRDIERTVSGTGSIAAQRDMPVGVVGEGGRVERVLVEPGDRVAAEQVLVQIDRSVQAQQIAALAASVNVARADARLAENNLARARALVGQGFVSKADIDSKTAQRDAAVARVNVAQAQLNQARASTARLDVRSPANGLVLSRNVEPGQIVSGGSGVLFHIAMNGVMEMKLALSQVDLGKVRPGDSATIMPIGASNAVTGRVWQVSPTIDPQSRQGFARILIGYDPSIRAGGFAQAQITTGREPAFIMPQSAVQSDKGGTFVYVVDRENHVRRRAVRTGDVSESGISVIGGLSDGEKVVVSAGGFLNPGDRVKPALQQPGN